MRAASRLLAAVTQSTHRVLEPGAPTGLTGLRTHPTPRSTLIYHYSNTLSKLQKVPEDSVYRQATEALTKKRLAIIESVKPPGFDRWNDQMQYRLTELGIAEGELTYEDRVFVRAQMWEKEKDLRDPSAEWDGETIWDAEEGAGTQEEKDKEMERWAAKEKQDQARRPIIDPEPLFTVDQIAEIEGKFGAGLLEEVIETAEAESKLVDVMVENKVWEDLVESAPEGQWVYFERKT